MRERILYVVKKTGHEGNFREFERAAGLKTDHLRKLLEREAERASAQVVAKIAAYGHVSMEWLTTGEHPDPNRTRPTLGNLDGWPEAETKVRAVIDEPDYVWERARALSALDAADFATPDLVMKAVELVRRFPAPGEDTEETREAKEKIAELKRNPPKGS